MDCYEEIIRHFGFPTDDRSTEYPNEIPDNSENLAAENATVKQVHSINKANIVDENMNTNMGIISNEFVTINIESSNNNIMELGNERSNVEYSKKDSNPEDQSDRKFDETHHTNHKSEVLSFEEFVDIFFNEDQNNEYSNNNPPNSMDNVNGKGSVCNSVDAQIKHIVTTSNAPESMLETSLPECHADNKEEENSTNFSKTGILSSTLCDNVTDVKSNADIVLEERKVVDFNVPEKETFSNIFPESTLRSNLRSLNNDGERNTTTIDKTDILGSTQCGNIIDVTSNTDIVLEEYKVVRKKMKLDVVPNVEVKSVKSKSSDSNSFTLGGTITFSNSEEVY
ncbi:myb-like protein F [Musca domestica]|uniref:Myb-like protein F n=1 Tax=Musca domestica TaxID=7370 RepID=A0ABM3VHK1_MUSDO|nr:myb-like protein F [Musca domestica]